MTNPNRATPTTSTPAPASTEAGSKPHLAFLIATSLGLGYLPLTPGTWGSLMGILLAWIALHVTPAGSPDWAHFLVHDLIFTVIVSVIGVWAADRAARYAAKKDPQFIVIDEVAGQLIAYLGLATPRTFGTSWKYLLAGWVFFRLLDVWKPFPARQAESLHGGWGIMADDWIAGLYAALALALLRVLGF